MDTCPHCSKQTISNWRKGNATSARPARCPSCGGLSYVAGWSHALAVLLVEAVFWGSMVIAILLHSWFALLLLPLGAGIFLLLHNGAELHATDASKVSQARVRLFAELVCLVIVVGGVYALFGSQ